MLHTPLNRNHPAAGVHHPHPHAPAQHAQTASTRCSPHAVHATHSSIPAHPHDINLADWLHMSPAQVAMMSPMTTSAPYTPPGHHHLLVPTPSPLQYANAVANASARNDFLATTSPLSNPSSPFHIPVAYPHLNPYPATSMQHQYQNQQAQMHHHQVPAISVSVENMHQHFQDPIAPPTHTVMGPSPLNTEFFSYANSSAQSLSASTSPISHQGSPFPYRGYARPTGQGESTPATTLSASDESQARVSSQEKGLFQPLIDKLRGASPVTDAGSNPPGSPDRIATKAAQGQSKPVESCESPFRIAAPQPRSGPAPFSPLPASSRPASALGALSELAELASRQSTPLPSPKHQHGPTASALANATTMLVSSAPHSHPPSRPISRPASSLSTRSTASHAKASKTRRRQLPPHRFMASLLRVQLAYQSPPGSGEGHGHGNKPMTPSLVDGLPRGPLECEDDHRYRTRSKLRILKAEIQEREREADLMLIRRGLRGEDSADLNTEKEGGASGLEMLASVSVTRRIGLDLEPEMNSATRIRSNTPRQSRASTPLSSKSALRQGQKKAPKRAFRELEDADAESTASEYGGGNGTRTPSKRPRIPTEKKASSMENIKKETTGARTLRSRMTRQVSADKMPARSSSSRSSNYRGKKAEASVKSAVVKKTVWVKENVPMDVSVAGESELSSLSSMSETEDNKSSGEDTDYSPRKTKATSRSKSSVSAPVTKLTTRASAAASAKTTSPSAVAKSACMSIDTARGASAIPMPIRSFPADVPIHASFPLLYRKFPVPGYTDPNANIFDLSLLGNGNLLSSLTSLPASSQGLKANNGEGELFVPPPPSSGHFNPPRFAEDLYTPRFVRGVGRDKMGLCPICYESPERGGVGKAEWLSMKFSAFNYHMQYAHGISPVTALPFSPPIAFRIASRTPNHKNEKSELLEGKCHRCQEWAAVEGVKCVEAKLKEIYWWKHAAQCHKGSNITEERDIHIEDAVAMRVKKVFEAIQKKQTPSNGAGTSTSASSNAESTITPTQS